jgi:hypothetical protein
MKEFNKIFNYKGKNFLILISNIKLNFYQHFRVISIYLGIDNINKKRNLD